MINPSFQQLLYSQSLDTWVISSVAKVDALVDEVYQQFLGHELKKNSRKTKSTLKTILLNLYSAFVSDPELYVMYSRDENLYSSHNRYVSQFVSYQSLVTKVIPGLVRLSLIQDNPGFIDREFNTGFVSRMKSTAGLIDLFLKHKLQPWMLEVSSEKEVIILKNTEKKFERYKDTDFTSTARQQLQHINGHLQAAYIDLWISCFTGYADQTPKKTINISVYSLTKHCIASSVIQAGNNMEGSMEFGGRIFRKITANTFRSTKILQ